jgi:hypothetical protein
MMSRVFLSSLRLGNLHFNVHLCFTNAVIFNILLKCRTIPTQSLRHVIRTRLDHRRNRHLGLLFFFKYFILIS